MCISVSHLSAPLLTIIPTILNRYLFCFSFVFFTAPINFILSFVRIKQTFLRGIIRCPPVFPESSEHVCTFLMPVCFPPAPPKISGNTAQGKLRRFAEISYPDFVAISRQYVKYYCKTVPRQYAKFTRESLLSNYAVLP